MNPFIVMIFEEFQEGLKFTKLDEFERDTECASLVGKNIVLERRRGPATIHQMSNLFISNITISLHGSHIISLPERSFFGHVIPDSSVPIPCWFY